MKVYTLGEWNNKKKKKDEEVNESGGLKVYSYDEWAKEKGIQPITTNHKTINTKEEDIAPVKPTVNVTESTQKNSYLQKGALSDGFSLGNIRKARKATEADIAEDATKGILGLLERAWDGFVQLSVNDAYMAAESANIFKDKALTDANQKVYEQGKKEAAEYVAKDLIKEEEIARKIITEPWEKGTGINVESSSIFGSKSDELVQSASDMLVRQGLNYVVPGSGLALTGLSSLGGEAENAYQNGATYEQALLSGMISAGAEVGTEMIAGIKFGGKSLTDGVVKSIARKVPNKVLGTLAKWGFNTVGEGAEGVIAGQLTAVGQHLTYQSDKELDELFSNEDKWESFLAEAILGGVFETGSVAVSGIKGVDYVTEVDKNEQKVIDAVYDEMLAERETDGKKLTQGEKNKLYESVGKALEKGYIDIDTIEKTLGGETYKNYKATVDKEDALMKEYEDLGNVSNPTLAQTTRYNELTQHVKDIKENSKRNQLKEQLSNEVFSVAQNSRLAESYNEKARRSKVFEADLTKYDAKQQEVVKKAIDSGILNNTNRTHEFVDMIAKISADKGVLFDFANNEKLKESGFAIGDKTINGFVKDGNVTLNIDSAKSLNSVVGHEITHVLEGTELYGELQSIVTAFAKTKGEYDARYQELTKLYENVEGANVDAELVADLVGDYLFTDENFINNLSTEKPNIFQKIYDEIKYLCKVATAGSKEARELEKVKKAFEKAYKEGANYSSDERLSLSSMGNTFFGNAEMTADEEGVIRFSLSEDSKGRDVNPAVQKRFANSKAVDENGNLKVLYHGTASGEFSIFDKSKGNVEGDFGSGFYFTDNENDVSEHYEGGGPDFENKVARRAEQIESYEDIDYAEAEERARKELYKGSHKFEVYLNIEKPAIVGETILFDPDTYYSQYDADDYESEEDYEGEVEQLVADDIDNIIWDIDRNMDINSTDGIAEVLWNALNEGGIDIESLKSQINELYIEDSYGNFVGNEVVRQIIESLGYDGIIDPTVSSKWNMDMEEGTTHYIVFKPNQIKAVTNENPTDNPDIHLSLSKRKGAAQHGNYNTYGKDIRLDVPTTETETQIPVEETQMESEIAPTTEEDARQYFSVSEQEEEVALPSEEDNESERIAGEDLTKKNVDRIRTIQSEIKGHQLTKNVTKEEFAKKIAQKESEYESLKRKDTKKALDLRNQITRLETRRDALIKSLDNKIERANKRIENIEKESRYEKRKTKQNQYRELFGKLMGDTSTWKDKKMGIYYQTNTLRRNLRDVVRDADGNRDIARADAIYDELQGSVNRNEAKKNREANKVKTVFREMKINNAESTYIQMLGELRHNPDTTLTAEIVDEYYQNNKGKIDAQKVDKAIDEARKLYDSLYDRVNAALSEHGFKEMGYRKGYFPHFTDPKQNWLAKLLNWKVKNDEIPTDIAGLTELFEPQRTWQSFDKHRMSDATDYNFLKGLDNYVDGALDWIYHIGDIQKNRAFETEIRYRHSSEQVQKKIDEYRSNPMLSAEEVESLIQNVLREAKNPLNNFVTDLHTRTNILAGKKSSKDRNMESDFNRHAYSIMTNVTNRVTANQVVGSISSAMTNFIPITQSWGQVNPTSSLVGMKKTIQSYISDDGVVAKSDFLTNRLAQNEALYKDAWDKIGDKVGGLMEIVDNFTSQTVWRSKYHENIKSGMSEAQAIKDADQFAENVIAGRSKGNQPTIFHAKNPVTKMLTSFQLEVSNQYGYMFKDMPQDIGKEAIGKLAKGYATMFVGAYAFNALSSAITGRDSAFDPIGIIEDFIRDLGGDDDEEEKVANAIGGLASNIAEEIPYVGGLLGGGRIPISSALPYNASISDAYADVVDGDWKSILDEMSKPLYYGVLPMGGGQIRKTVQGLSMFDDDLPVSGSYTKSGSLRFPVEDTVLNRFQAALFGQYASSNAREYFDRGQAPLKEKQIEEYIEVDLPIREYWDYREGLSKQETLEEKFDYIADLDVSVEQKNIMINNVVDRKEKVDMSNYDDFANYEEFDFYSKNTEKYNFLQDNGISYSEYKADKKKKEEYDSIYSWYKNNPEKVTFSKAVTDNVIEYKQYTSDLNDIRADKDANGESISGSAKAKKIDYINGLDLDYGQKIILFRTCYDSKEDKATYNAEIVDYLNSREDLSYEEIITILEELDFTVHADGTVEW